MKDEHSQASLSASSRPTFHLSDVFALISFFSILFALLRLVFLLDSPLIVAAAFFLSPFLIGGVIGWAVARNLDGIVRGVFGAYCFPFLVGIVVAFGAVMANPLIGKHFDTWYRPAIVLIIATIPVGGWIGGYWASQDRKEGNL